MAGITCADFEQAVFDEVMDIVVGGNATFSDAECSDDADDSVSIMVEVTVPLVVVALYDDDEASVLHHVTTILVEAVSTGSFTATVQSVASGRRLSTPSSVHATASVRRLSMANAQATGVSCDTHTPTPVPTPVPTAMPTSAPSIPPTSMPTAVPTLLPFPVPTFVPSAAPTSGPTAEGCQNGHRDGNETDVDCGGNHCRPCGRYHNCTLDSDCFGHGHEHRPGRLIGVCINGVCDIMPTPAPTSIPSPGPTPTPTTPRPTALPTALPSPLPSTPPSPRPSPLPTPYPTKVEEEEDNLALGAALGMLYFMLSAMFVAGVLALNYRRRHYVRSKQAEDSSSLWWWCTHSCPMAAHGDSPVVVDAPMMPEPTLGFNEDGTGGTSIEIEFDEHESKAAEGDDESFDAKVNAAAAAAAAELQPPPPPARPRGASEEQVDAAAAAAAAESVPSAGSFDAMVEEAAAAAAAESAASAALDEDSTEEAKRAAQAVLDAEIELLKVRMEARDAEIERLRHEMSAPPTPPPRGRSPRPQPVEPIDPAALDLAALEARGWKALNLECKRRGLPDRGPTRDLARRLKEAASATSEA